MDQTTAPSDAQTISPGIEEKLEPTLIVIFGITGDLAGRYLLPALYHLFKVGLLDSQTEIIGVTRRDVAAQELISITEANILSNEQACDQTALQELAKALSMYKMNLTDGNDYDKLLQYLNSREDERGICMDRLYYLSIPPGASEPVVDNLGEHGLNKSCQHGKASTRLLLEKPFGYDLVSAREFIEEVAKQFTEEQVFRIDHYLAKETVQNILTFRMYNPIFDSLWSNANIARIDIAASEKIDIEGRSTFYEQTGALRDVVQSHLLQLLAVTTMEKPAAMNSDAIHLARLKLLESIEPVPADRVTERTLRGQYEGYRGEVGNPQSTIETYASVQLFVNNDRWRGVPVVIRAGKALNERYTEITITFRQTSDLSYGNRLVFRVQPNEGIGISLCVKRPGFDNQVDSTSMDFSYARSFQGQSAPNAYEYVLVDAIRGDRTLFATSDEVLASWRILEPVIKAWAQDASYIQMYKKGSTGPVFL